jgi:archaellum component FlaC
MPEDTSKQEILEAINSFSQHMDAEIGGIKTEIGGIKTEIGGIKTEITRIQATMVTKDYLDEKLFDMKGDIVSIVRKEDAKLKVLVDVLIEKKVLSKEDEKRILSMEPFPQLYP